MNERVFSGGVERLRTPERLAWLEPDRAVELALNGIQAESMLDMGTGSGIFAEGFDKRGLAVTGIDSNPEMVAAARSFVPAADLRQALAEALPFPDRSFDLVFLGLVLHEADDLEQALSEAKRVAKQRVALLEWPFREEEKGPPLAHRLPAERIAELAHHLGFNGVSIRPLTHLDLYLLDL